MEAGHRGILIGILLWAAGVFTLGIGWGLPSLQGWAGDEIHPAHVAEGSAQGFSDGWHFKYPPLHFRLLSWIYRPLGRLAGAGWLPSDRLAFTTVRMLAGRLLSVLMSLGTVLSIYLLSRRLFDRRAALFAAFTASSTVTLVYFAKTANPVAPFVFWATVSLLFYVRVLESHRLRDYLLLALSAAAAVGTKDEAYALYLLAPIPIAWSLAAHRPEAARLRRLGRVLLDPRPWAALMTFAIALALGHGLPGNLQGFLAHLEILADPSLQAFRAFDPTLGGQARLLARALGQVAFSLNPLLFLAAVTGLAITARETLRSREDGRLARRWSLLLLAISSYAGFIALILFSHPRYLLPATLILTPFAGAGLAALTAPGARRLRLRWLAAAGIVAYSALYALSVDLRMLADTRYAVEAWIAHHREPGEVAVAVGRRRQVPRLRRLPWPRVLRSKGAALHHAGALWVVINLSDLRGPRERRLYDRLLGGDLGYERVWHGRGEPLFDLIGDEAIRRALSELRFTNPELAVFAQEEVASRVLRTTFKP